MASRMTNLKALSGILSALALTACVDQVGFTAVEVAQTNDEAPVDPDADPSNPPADPDPVPSPRPSAEPPAPPAPSPQPSVEPPAPPAPSPSPSVTAQPSPQPPAPPAPSPSPSVVAPPPAPSPSPSVVVPPPAPSPSPMPSVVICDPFSNGGQADPKNGIKASLHYFEVGDSRISSVKTTQNFAAGMAGVVTPNTTVYMNYLNVPTRSFSDGFVTDGGDLMRTMSGDPLIEWFSLRMESNLTAPSVAEEGWYQFAMNADDGAILKVDPNKDGVFDTLVDNDGIHAPALKCASKAIYLEAGKPIPFKLNYFQGPRYHITMQLLWRKVSGPSNNLSCNANSLSPVPVKAFELEPGRPNPCADASNPGSSVLEDDVLDQYGCGEKADKKVLVCKGPAGNSNNSVEVCVALQAAINGHQTPLNGSVGPTGNHLGACK